MSGKDNPAAVSTGSCNLPLRLQASGRARPGGPEHVALSSRSRIADGRMSSGVTAGNLASRASHFPPLPATPSVPATPATRMLPTPAFWRRRHPPLSKHRLRQQPLPPRGHRRGRRVSARAVGRYAGQPGQVLRVGICVGGVGRLADSIGMFGHVLDHPQEEIIVPSHRCLRRWPSQRAVAERSTPCRSNPMAAEWR